MYYIEDLPSTILSTDKTKQDLYMEVIELIELAIRIYVDLNVFRNRKILLVIRKANIYFH